MKEKEEFRYRQVEKSYHSYRIVFFVLLGLGIVVSILFMLKLFVRKDKDEESGVYDIVEEE